LEALRIGLNNQKRRRNIVAIEDRETGNLIGSDKVEGTAVYGADNQKIGSIQRVMIDKQSGKVSYAVLSFGGFLGIGDDYYPLPWQSLKYDTSLGGYRTGITENQLKGAPKYNNDNSWNWNDPARARSVTAFRYKSLKTHLKRTPRLPREPFLSLKHSLALRNRFGQLRYDRSPATTYCGFATALR
jgi:hypothetical protein